MRYTAAVVAMLAMCSTPALAQTSAASPPVPHQQILSTNPFGPLVEWYNAEYERKIAPATTLGVSVSHFAEPELSNAALILRWYPQRAAFDGFFLGARAGAYRFETYEYEYPTSQPYPSDPSRRTYPIPHKRAQVNAGVGMEIGYNWLLGAKQNVSFGLGFGLTRILGNSNGDYDLQVLPGPRVNIGIAF